MKTIKQLLWASLPALLLLLSACSTEFDSTPEVATEVYKVAKFSFPDNGYTIAINGTPADSVVVDREKSKLVTINKPFWVEVTKEGQQLFADSVTYNESGVITFYDVVGHGLLNLPEERQHLFSVAVAEPNENVKILIKGLEGHPEGVPIENTASYMLDQADVEKGGLTVEVSQGSTLLWSKPIKEQATNTQVSLLWTPEQTLIALNPPTQEMRDMLVNEYDTWVSFMYSSEDYPGVKSLVLKIASDQHLIMSDEQYQPLALKEGYTPITYTLEPDTPSEFQFVEIMDDGSIAPYLYIVELYDPEKPDEPLDNIFSDDQRPSYVYQCNSFAYARQGEGNSKFRCYKFVPKGHPDVRKRYKGNTYGVFQPDYSFE